MRHDFGCLKYIELGCKRAGIGWIGMLCHTQWGEKVSEGEILTTDKRTYVWSCPSCIYTQIFIPKRTGFHL